jgi:hypothetical protein
MKRMLYGITSLFIVCIGLWLGVLRHKSPGSPQTTKLPTMEEFKKRPGGELTVSAGNFLVQLKKQGGVPGFTSEEVGVMRYADGFEGNTYPVSRTFHIQKDDSSDYHYTVVRDSESSPWHLQKGWRTDGEGKTIENYPIQ